MTKRTRKPTIKQRARAILDNDRYDEDTHNAIRRALDNNDPELGDLVDRAERGDIILDLIGEQEKFEKAASFVVEVINKSSAPDWLTTAMLVAIEQARKIKSVRIFKEAANGSGEDFDVKELANLFVLTQRLDLEPRIAPTARQRIADALSELLCNPETPTRLFEVAADYVAEASSGEDVAKAIYWQPEVLGKLIEYRLDSLGDTVATEEAHTQSQRLN